MMYDNSRVVYLPEETERKRSVSIRGGTHEVFHVNRELRAASTVAALVVEHAEHPAEK